MNEITLKKYKLLLELADKVEEMKKSDEFIDIDFDLGINKNSGNFEKQNDKVFRINMYVITKLFKSEYEEIKKKNEKFTLDEYYDFIENLKLPDTIYELYMKMPNMIKDNKILSYITDIPSFMGIVKD